jgi:hypothetical protein
MFALIQARDRASPATFLALLSLRGLWVDPQNRTVSWPRTHQGLTRDLSDDDGPRPTKDVPAFHLSNDQVYCIEGRLI